MSTNKNERAEVVKAMETIARCVNDEDVLESWLMCGVADGDINEDTTADEIIEMGYTTDDTFKDVMSVFLRMMKNAWNSGGLYCDGVVSKSKEDYE